jgi:hypothetical protein
MPRFYSGQIFILPRARECDFKCKDAYILQAAKIEAPPLSFEQLCSLAGCHVQIETDDASTKVLGIIKEPVPCSECQTTEEGRSACPLCQQVFCQRCAEAPRFCCDEGVAFPRRQR